mmetsp:Transcript_39274/g.37706  ORF Transcript_39274/g.37706 Transcript_39274/m.37706 type:complete len:229 (-) Transcript_39274:61-747(-)
MGFHQVAFGSVELSYPQISHPPPIVSLIIVVILLNNLGTEADAIVVFLDFQIAETEVQTGRDLNFLDVPDCHFLCVDGRVTLVKEHLEAEETFVVVFDSFLIVLSSRTDVTILFFYIRDVEFFRHAHRWVVLHDFSLFFGPQLGKVYLDPTPFILVLLQNRLGQREALIFDLIFIVEVILSIEHFIHSLVVTAVKDPWSQLTLSVLVEVFLILLSDPLLRTSHNGVHL